MGERQCGENRLPPSRLPPWHYPHVTWWCCVHVACHCSTPLPCHLLTSPPRHRVVHHVSCHIIICTCYTTKLHHADVIIKKCQKALKCPNFVKRHENDGFYVHLYLFTCEDSACNLRPTHLQNSNLPPRQVHLANSAPPPPSSMLYLQFVPVGSETGIYPLFARIPCFSKFLHSKLIEELEFKVECAPACESPPFNSLYEPLFKRKPANLALLCKLAIKTLFEPISARRVNKTAQTVSHFVQIPCKRAPSPMYYPAAQFNSANFGSPLNFTQ